MDKLKILLKNCWVQICRFVIVWEAMYVHWGSISSLIKLRIGRLLAMTKMLYYCLAIKLSRVLVETSSSEVWTLLNSEISFLKIWRTSENSGLDEMVWDQHWAIISETEGGQYFLSMRGRSPPTKTLLKKSSFISYFLKGTSSWKIPQIMRPANNRRN